MIDFFDEMKRIILVSVLILMFASGCYDRHSYPPESDYVPSANCTAEALRNLCKEGCYTISSEMSCVGYVTSSDRAGNFYHTLLIEDETGAVEILIGTHLTASLYPIGTLIELRLEGLAAMLNNGVVQVGLTPQSFDIEPRPMGSKLVINNHLIRCGKVEEVTPLSCSVAELNSSLCGRLVTIHSLHHTPLEGYEEEQTMVGYHRFTDSEGNAIFTHVSDYADFANGEVPTSDTSITGILYHESVEMNIGYHYVIRARSANDITTNTHTY